MPRKAGKKHKKTIQSSTSLSKKTKITATDESVWQERQAIAELELEKCVSSQNELTIDQMQKWLLDICVQRAKQLQSDSSTMTPSDSMSIFDEPPPDLPSTSTLDTKFSKNQKFVEKLLSVDKKKFNILNGRYLTTFRSSTIRDQIDLLEFEGKLSNDTLTQEDYDFYLGKIQSPVILCFIVACKNGYRPLGVTFENRVRETKKYKNTLREKLKQENQEHLLTLLDPKPKQMFKKISGAQHCLSCPDLNLFIC